jgi:DNA-binding transcriptional regulator/RsmH inhibitor MraZ
MNEEHILLPFSGHEYRTIDVKCRVVIPAKIRERITQRNPKCHDVWFQPEVRNESNFLSCYDLAGLPKKLSVDGAYVQYATPDSQSRIVVPKFERQFARLLKDVVIAASPDMTHFELWNKEYFEKSYGTKPNSANPQ